MNDTIHQPVRGSRAWPRVLPWGLALACCAVMLPVSLQAQGPARPTQSQGSASRLASRWQRTDGGYILDIRGATSDGKLDVSYFNPRSIHVARAEWGQKDGVLGLFIELRDTNYPGSVYTLQVSPDGKRLTGNYFQAAQKVDYPVEFVRMETPAVSH